MRIVIKDKDTELLVSPEDYALNLFLTGFSFMDFSESWPSLAGSEYGDLVKVELDRLQN